jgi:hypothetical protein
MSRVDDRAWTLSWMSMKRIDLYPGRDRGSPFRARKKAVTVTAAASQVTSPKARIHGVEPDTITTRPATATARPR